MKKKFKKTAALFFTAAITAGSVIACGGGSQSAPADATASYTSFDMAAPMARAGGGMMDGGYYPEGGEMNGYAVAETAAAAPAYDSIAQEAAMYEEDVPASNLPEVPISPIDDSDFSKPAGKDSGSQPQSALRRKLIRTVSLDVETTDFDNLLPSIQQTVVSDGGYIEQSDVSGTSISTGIDRKRYAFLTVRIPSDKLDGFLTQMSDQSNVINRSENVQDVTLQYTDIESRKKSLTIEQERLWALLEKADTLEAVIALEERLSEIRYQLEGFESQLRTYDNQVDYSTVHISIQEVGVFTPTAPDSIGTRIQKGFVRNLENVSNSLTDLLVWVISHLPALVLLGIVVGGIGLLVRKITNRKLGRRKKDSDGDSDKKVSE